MIAMNMIVSPQTIGEEGEDMLPFSGLVSAISSLRLATFALLTALASLAWAAPAAAQTAQESPAPAQQNQALVLTLEGAIGPASAAYITSGLERAREQNASLVIIEMDTPGGLDTSMRKIIQGILAMPIPVATYVHPSGARAASAGTYILYASHIAAMTPGTNLGAATPIQIGGSPSPAGDGEEGEEAAAAPANASERKAVNDAVAYIRSLAEMRGRNADWAEEAVRQASSLSASAALEQGVIDIVAADRTALLEQLDGRSVEVAGQEQVLSTSDMAVAEVEPDWTTELLATITNPNVAMILMMVGIYGLFFEFMNPGSLVPGTIGGISLLVALYGLTALPVDFAGVALIVLGLALMVAEAFAPSFGILGIGGLASFVIGSAIMVDTDVPEFQIDWSIIAALGVFSAVLLFFIARVSIKSFRHPVRSGQEELIGAGGEVSDWKGGKGHVFVHSERWNATGPEALKKGERVVVLGVKGLRLSVAAAPEGSEQT